MPESATRPCYITTPIYYVNDRPHIGHCYTTLLADVAARAQRLIGRDVFFLTGTDEHAEKVSKAAAERGLSPLEWATQNAERFREAFAFMGFSNDDFVRTTEDRHTTRASAYIQKLVDSGDIELGDYEGWYDPSQEEYVTESTAKEHDYNSPVTGKPLEKRTEQNYFFRLDKYEGWLKTQIESDAIRVLPEARKNEVLGRIRQGLQKVPVSRRIKEGDADWGIRMPNDPEHRIYVWIEALCNYLTIVDEPDRRKYWPKLSSPVTDGGGGPAGSGVGGGASKPSITHLMAKDILWFHAVIWPCMLHALGEQPPATVYAHAYWISEGRKMSKSLGNFIEIDQLRAYADKFHLDAVRWFLTTQGPLGATDADFAHARFVEVYNADLANGIGNAASRVGNMIVKYFEGKVPDTGGENHWFGVGDSVTEHYHWNKRCEQSVSIASDWVDEIDLRRFCEEAIKLAATVDRFINDYRPFSLAKLDPNAEFEGPSKTSLKNRQALAVVLYQCAEALRIASLLLWPAMPTKMAELWRNWDCSPLNDPNDPDSGFKAPLAELATWAHPQWGLKPGTTICKGDALFMRADPAEPAPGAPGASGGE
ncbi:MAG: methionine--tRNA ligase [Phycisphaeraceae bacterium]|nr:MAG: methionine--tRNA ligase [Phycisphaeraceae bacterium]